MGDCGGAGNSSTISLGLSSIIVSHDVNEVLSIADNVYVLADKKIIAHGPAHSLLQQIDNPLLQQFLHGQSEGPVPFHFQAEDFKVDLQKVKE